MSLLAPALLVGLIGLGLPIAAHLLGRQRPLEIKFAAMRFLPSVEPAVTQRRAIQDIPLFIVRALLLALLVLVLARPSSSVQGGVTMVAEVHDAVILLDASRSTELRVDGQTLRAREVEVAYTLLDSLPAGTRVGLRTSNPDGPSIEPTADPEQVRAAVERWGDQPPTPGAWRMSEALPDAAAMLRALGGGERKRVIYAIGDATPDGLADLPLAAEGGAMVLPLPVLEPDTVLPEHIAVTSVDWAPAPDLDPKAVRIEAVVHRYTHGRDDVVAERDVAVGLFIADKEVARGVVTVAADEDAPVEFTHTMLDEGSFVGEYAAVTVALLDLDDDPLPSDDRRHVWITADDGIEVAVVNGDPSELRAHDEVYFLTTAIAAANADRSIRLRSLAPDQLDEAVRSTGVSALEDIDVLVLANVGVPAPDVTPAIIERVEQGMGLWITLGDRLATGGYNDQLGKLLPLRLRGAVEVGTAPGRTEARAEGIAPADLSHPIFRGIAGDLKLAGARARRIMLLDPDPKSDARIALSFTSGAPALLTKDVADGRVALLTTSIDRDWADLPLRPGFVPLIAGTLRFLGGGVAGQAGSNITVGATRKIRTDAPIVIRAPGGREVSIAPESGFAVFEDTSVPGHYQARLGESGSSMFAVVVDPGESQTAPGDVAEADVEGGREVAVSVPRWRWLVLLGVGLLVAEAVLRWRAHQQKAPSR